MTIWAHFTLMLYLSPPDPKSLDWRWPNFTPVELACRCRGRHCGGEYWHDPAFLNALQKLRDQIGRLVITSGHRCAGWNASVGGAPASRHLNIAVDVSLMELDRFAVLAAAEQLGFTGIGLARTFIHLDRRVSPARWYYQRSKSSWQT
jgi:hypothetical protein